jgi:hypothetical protein
MGSIFSNLKLGIVTTLSEYSHILNLGLKVLGLGRTLYLWELILDSRGEAVRHNIKHVRRYVRQPLLRHSNINPNN